MIKKVLLSIFLLVCLFKISHATDFKDFNLSYNSCRYLINVEKNLDSIKNNILTWTKEDCSCKLDLIDSLTDNYIKSGDERFYYCLVAVCNVADISLYNSLLESNGMMFYGIFDKYLKAIYHYKKYYHEEHCFVNYLIEALSLEVYTSNNPKKEINEIQKYIETETHRYNFSEEEKKYLSDLIKKIDPSIWGQE
ncbi:MAG: hypothetical protein N2319_07965 [Candidatus Kapabacteria bacterium]|nr:hypothetical protein [Candidatus Kapabacteria bacterium]